MRYPILILSSILLMLASCEKVINVDLKNSDKRVVIQGFITDESGTVNHTIMISRSVAFSASNEPDFVQGAFVVVTDLTEGKSDTTLEVSPGNYQTQRTPGVPGHTYQLVAKVGDETFTSTSTMPDPVPFDSLYVDSFSAFGGVLHQFTPVFQDPAGQPNYYAFQLQINDTLLNTIDAWDDQYSDGKINSRPLNVNDEDLFSGKDTVTVTMYCTEKAIYNFFYTLVNATGNGQTPANPLSTISGNALGYFGAVTMRRRVLIMP